MSAELPEVPAETLKRAASLMREYAARGVAWGPEWDGDQAADEGWIAPIAALHLSRLLDDLAEVVAFYPLRALAFQRAALDFARTYLGDTHA